MENIKMKNGTLKMENEKWKKELGSYGGNAVVKTILAKRKRNLRVMDPSNSYLRKIGIREDRKCTLHYKEKDLMHLFWQCEKKKMF